MKKEYHESFFINVYPNEINQMSKYFVKHINSLYTSGILRGLEIIYVFLSFICHFCPEILRMLKTSNSSSNWGIVSYLCWGTSWLAGWLDTRAKRTLMLKNVKTPRVCMSYRCWVMVITWWFMIKNTYNPNIFYLIFSSMKSQTINVIKINTQPSTLTQRRREK